MPTTTLDQLKRLISISSQIVLISKDSCDDDGDIEAISADLLALAKDLSVIVSPLRSYQRFVNASANAPRI